MGSPRFEKGGQAEYTRAIHKSAVKQGFCGYCGAKRNRYKWLCDECAEDHREKQRLKAWAKRQDELLGIVATWTAPFPLKRPEPTMKVKRMLIRMWWSEYLRALQSGSADRVELDRLTDRCVSFGVMGLLDPIPRDGAEDVAAQVDEWKRANGLPVQP